MVGKVDNRDYVQLQLLNQQLQELDGAINQSNHQIEVALIASQTLETLSTSSPNQELLIPLGSGAFLEVQASAVDKVKLVVGAGVVVDKSVPDTIATIKSQLGELHAFQEKTIELYSQVVDKINSLQAQIESNMKGSL